MNHDVDVAEIENEDGIITVIAPQTEFYKAKTALTEAFGDINFEMEEISFVPQTHTDISGEDVQMMENSSTCSMTAMMCKRFTTTPL